MVYKASSRPRLVSVMNLKFRVRFTLSDPRKSSLGYTVIMDAYSERGIERKDSSTPASSNEDASAQPQPARRRVHYGILAALYLIVLVLAGVALGMFGTSETDVHKFVTANYPPDRRANNCILYASYLGYEIGDVRQVAMFNPGPLSQARMTPRLK